MLHPRFMTALNPDENLEAAVRKVEPEFRRMLHTVLDGDADRGSTATR